MFAFLLIYTDQQKNAELDDSAQDGGHGTPHPSDVLDMPVDPNEPTYCLCHQVSYGEMIGCDNPDVRIRPSLCQRHGFRIYFQFCSVPLSGSILLASGLPPSRKVSGFVPSAHRIGRRNRWYPESYRERTKRSNCFVEMFVMSNTVRELLETKVCR